MIQINNLTKQYKLYKNPQARLKEALSFGKRVHHKKFMANKDISFSIKKGEVVGIIGQNGSGKSTLLKMITGVLTPTSGSIQLNGTVTAMLELTAGFNPELTGMENLYLASSIHNLTKKDIESRILDIIDFSEIGDFIYQPLKIYSSGMKARLGFAFSIHIDPEILIIDEALSVGDVAFSRKCYAKIESMCKDNEVTVLFVSHSDSTIINLCNRAILLHEGELVLDGNPKDVVTQYLKLGKSPQITKKEIQKEYLQIQQNAKVAFKKEVSDNSLFTSSLISKSVVALNPDGAYIDTVQILNTLNTKVNILEYSFVYKLTYRVTFTEDKSNIFFAIFIKTKDGISVGGKEFMASQKIYRKGKTYTIEWNFKNILANGYYFINCAIISKEYGRHVLHRIYDAYLFKVNDTQSLHFTGNVDLDLQLNIKDIYEKN